MDVVVRSNNNPVNDMTAPVSWLINDLDKAIWLLIVMDCQSGYSYHQQDKQIQGGCFRNREGQAAVQ